MTHPGKRPAGDRQQIANRIRDQQSNRFGNRFSSNWWRSQININNPHWHFHRHWGRYPARYWWRPVAWAGLTGWFAGWWTQPVYYNYGDTVYYDNGNVYYGDKEVCTAEQYYDQANTIAENVPEVDSEKTEWLPLGVFAVTQDDSGASNMLLQLAVSKEGIIAGTYFNETTQTSHPVEGSVDKKTQRAAWKISDGANPVLVMETGIYNLTQDEATLLVHFGGERTQQWLMVRLDEPEGEEPPQNGDAPPNDGAA